MKNLQIKQRSTRSLISLTVALPISQDKARRNDLDLRIDYAEIKRGQRRCPAMAGGFVALERPAHIRSIGNAEEADLPFTE